MTVSRPGQPRKALLITTVILLVALVAVFTAMIVLPSRLNASSDPPPAPRVYALPRAASDGVNFLYGEGDDVATECFVVGELTYVVGTTQSHAFDMTSELKGANDFVAVLSGGTVARVAVFGTDGNDACAASALGDDALVVLSQSDTDESAVVLYTIDYTSLEIAERVLRFPDRVRPVGLLVDGATTIVAAQAESDLDSNVLVYVLKNGAEQFLHTVDTTYAAYRYHALYCSPRGYELLATAYTGADVYPVVVSLGARYALSPFLQGRGLTLRASYPIGTGYRVLLSSDESETSVLATLDCGAHAVTGERSVAVTGEADLLPCGTDGDAIAAYEANALLFVGRDERRIDLFDARLLASALDEAGEPLFCVGGSRALTIFDAAGKQGELAVAAGDGSERDEVLAGRTSARAVFGDCGTVVFASDWTETGVNVGIAFAAA